MSRPLTLDEVRGLRKPVDRDTVHQVYVDRGEFERLLDAAEVHALLGELCGVNPFEILRAREYSGEPDALEWSVWNMDSEREFEAETLLDALRAAHEAAVGGE